jgi:hypothetical protein
LPSANPFYYDNPKRSMGLPMSINNEKWSEIISVTLVYIQETLDELISLQMKENTIRNYFSHMYFDISRENETEVTKVLLKKINMFRENNRQVFVSTLDFLIAPLHKQIAVLNEIIDNPSNDAKKKLVNAFNIQSRTEMFIKRLYHDEHEIITEYLELKNAQLQVFKEEKLKLDHIMRSKEAIKVDKLRTELEKINF